MSYKTICEHLKLLDIDGISDSNRTGYIDIKNKKIVEQIPNHIDYMIVYVTDYEILYGYIYKSFSKKRYPISNKAELQDVENGVKFYVQSVIPLKHSYYNSGVELQINESNVRSLRYPTYEDKLVYVCNFLA